MIKIKAFTLLEALVALALTSVLSGLLYLAYDVSIKQFRLFKNQQEAILQKEVFFALINSDFENSNKIELVNDSELKFHMIEGNDIFYKFSNNKTIVYRNQNQIELDIIETTWKTKQDLAEVILITDLEFVINYFDRENNIIFHKDYVNGNLNFE